MKVLFYRYGNVCEPDLLEQYQKIGFEVETIEEEIHRKNLMPVEQMELVKNKLDNDSFMFVFSINYFPVISKLCEIYRLPYVCWTVDAPVLELYSNTISNECNRFFVFDKNQYDFLSNYSKNVYYLPLATNTARWDNVCASITGEDLSKYSADISFVGSLYNEKDPYLQLTLEETALKDAFKRIIADIENGADTRELEENLSEEELELFRYKYPKFFIDAQTCIANCDRFSAINRFAYFHCASLDRIEMLTKLSTEFRVDLYTNSNVDCFKSVTNLICHGGVKTLTEMPKVFRLSKINLNLTIKSIERGLPLRIWDIMGCGGFLMTDYKPELEELLIPGVDYEDFISIEELIDKCRYYLAHDTERKKIAVNGYEKVSKYHTYINRMPAILGTLLK